VLEKLNLTDLHIVLNDEGYAVWREMPGTEHDTAVDLMKFAKWKENKALYFLANRTLMFLCLKASRGTRKGPQMALDEGTPPGNIELRKVMNPHVIFQLSWGYKLQREKLAVDDMSLYAGVLDNAALGRPNVTYLIKAKRRGAPSP
jgi:hypothetical protein